MTRASAPGTSCAPCAKRSRTSRRAVRREELEPLPEALGLELPELQQVERSRDEREREEGQPQHAEGDVQDKPGIAPGGGLGARRETDEEREPDEPGGEGPGEEAD